MKRIQIELIKMKAVSWMKNTLGRALGISGIVTEKVSELGRYSNENYPK